jgi:predicted nucleotidyltransferase
MHLEPLPRTSVEILLFLSSRLRERFTVRQIASGIGKDYRITYEMTMRLARQRYIVAEKRRPVTYCKPNLKGNASLFAYIEGIRTSRFLAKHRYLAVLVEDILQKITCPFVAMILFGSHVKGKASKGSDLDLLLVIPDKKIENDVSSAIGSIARVSPIGMHEVILTSDEFVGLLKQEEPNVAWEAVENRVVPYGAEPLFKMLEAVT